MDSTRRKWQRLFKEALEFDTWGQVEEAKENYTRLNNLMANEMADAVKGGPKDAPLLERAGEGAAIG